MIHYTKFISKNRSAEWITFVHGAGGSSTIWYKQIKYFSKILLMKNTFAQIRNGQISLKNIGCLVRKVL